MDRAKIKDALIKVKRTLSQTEKLQLSHWSWQGAVKFPNGRIEALEDNPELQFLELADAPPIVWEGAAGSHPLLRIIDEALIELEK
jgi:hypothetical protein